MREIKFRAWAGGVMVHFDLFNIRATDVHDNDKHIQRTESPHLSVSDTCPLMQYTGLKDKNGKEIYEGDIVEPVPNAIIKYEVVYNPNRAGFRLINKDNYDLDLFGLERQVIGNIYENPTLLE